MLKREYGKAQYEVYERAGSAQSNCQQIFAGMHFTDWLSKRLATFCAFWQSVIAHLYINIAFGDLLLPIQGFSCPIFRQSQTILCLGF